MILDNLRFSAKTTSAVAKETSPKSAKTPTLDKKGLLFRLHHEGSDSTVLSCTFNEEEEVTPTYRILETSHRKSEAASEVSQTRTNRFLSTHQSRRSSMDSAPQQPTRNPDAPVTIKASTKRFFSPLKLRRASMDSAPKHPTRKLDDVVPITRKPSPRRFISPLKLRRNSTDSPPHHPTQELDAPTIKTSPKNSVSLKPRRASMDTDPTRREVQNGTPRKQRRATMEGISSHSVQEVCLSPEIVLEAIRTDRAKQIKHREEIKAKIDDLVKMSDARLDYENKIGAVLTMKKIKKLQSDNEHVAEALEFLHAQECQVYQNVLDQNKAGKELCDLSYKRELCRILKQKLECSEASDEQLLKQVKPMVTARESEEVLGETVTLNQVSTPRMRDTRTLLLERAARRGQQG